MSDNQTPNLTGQQYRYAVVEDNGGGLALFILDDAQSPLYVATGYQHRESGALTADLDILDTGTDLDEWESDPDLDHQAEWDCFLTHAGSLVVAEGKAGRRILYPDRMGTAARLQFEIDDDGDVLDAAEREALKIDLCDLGLPTREEYVTKRRSLLRRLREAGLKRPASIYLYRAIPASAAVHAELDGIAYAVQLALLEERLMMLEHSMYEEA